MSKIHKKNNQWGYGVLIFFISVLFMIVPAFGATWTVGPGENFESLDFALASSDVSDGDSLFLSEGTHVCTANVSIGKSVRISGVSSNSTVIDLGNFSFLPKKENIELRNMKIENGSFGIATQGTSSFLLVEDCVFKNLSHKDGIKLTRDNIIFKNNTFSDETGFTTLLNVTGNSVSVINNTFENNTGSGTASRIICFTNASNPVIVGNTIHKNNAEAIRLWKGKTSDGLIAKNKIYDNTKGIVLYDSGPAHEIYMNDIYANTVNIASGGALQSSLSFFSPDAFVYAFNNTTFTSKLGNHWGSQQYEDIDGNGISDSSVPVLNSFEDSFPLIHPFNTYSVSEEPIHTHDPLPTDDPFPTDDTPVDSGSISLNATILPLIEVVFSTTEIDFGNIRPGKSSEPFGVDITNNGDVDFVVTAEVCDSSDDIFKTGLWIDETLWSAYSKNVNAKQTETSYFVLKVPRDYSGVSNPSGNVIMWVDSV